MAERSETRRPERRPDPWKRDATHLIAGSILGTLVAVIFFQFARQSTSEDLRGYEAIRNFVAGSYVEEMDPDEVLDRALRGLIEGLDPYSRYYDRNQISAINRDTSGLYKGIGVVFAPLSPAGQVLFPVEGSPAQEGGIQVGDRILTVDGRVVEQLSTQELLGVIHEAGPDGLAVHVADREGRERDLTLIPRELEDPSVRHARLIDPGAPAGGRIGYVAVTSFSRRTPEELDRALAGLGALDALVIDVRGNPGGVLEAAVDLANLFVAEGPLVTHEGRTEVVVYRADPDKARLAGMPLAVLVNGDAASASEVFAAALQDHRAAAIVGSPTYGKGVVQEVRRFGDDRMVVKLTTAYYYTPSRRNLERTVDRAWNSGLQPDLWVELTDEEAREVAMHLSSYAPPDGALEALRAWEDDLGAPLVPTHPADPQLDAALALFRGERPGAWHVASASTTGSAPPR